MADAIRLAGRSRNPLKQHLRALVERSYLSQRGSGRGVWCELIERIEAPGHGTHAELQALGSADVHVQHIIPQKIKTKKSKDEFGDWVSYLGEKSETLHPRYVARIGNLTLFAGALKISASNNPFAMKTEAYEASGILLTRALAVLPHFTFSTVDQRSAELAAKAVELWPNP